MSLPCGPASRLSFRTITRARPFVVKMSLLVVAVMGVESALADEKGEKYFGWLGPTGQ